MESGRGHINAEAVGAGVSGSVGCVNNINYFLQFWKLRVQDKGAGRFGSRSGPASWLAGGHPLAVSSHGSKSVSELSGVFLINTLILSDESPTLMTLFNRITPIKTLFLNTVT